MMPAREVRGNFEASRLVTPRSLDCARDDTFGEWWKGNRRGATRSFACGLRMTDELGGHLDQINLPR
jgi:hypothetical protein